MIQKRFTSIANEKIGSSLHRWVLVFFCLIVFLNFKTGLAANDIDPANDNYSAVSTAKPIVLDGQLNEWVGVPMLADPKFSIPKGSGPNGKYVAFEEYGGGTWSGPDDQSSVVQIVYDSENVYLGVIVTDDYHENAARSAWNGDSVQLMVATADRQKSVGLYHYALGGVDGDLGGVIVMHEAGPGGTQAIVTRNTDSKRTCYEIKLPASSMGLPVPL